MTEATTCEQCGCPSWDGEQFCSECVTEMILNRKPKRAAFLFCARHVEWEPREDSCRIGAKA